MFSFLLSMFDDSIEGIYETLKAAAMISKQVRTGAVSRALAVALSHRAGFLASRADAACCPRVAVYVCRLVESVLQCTTFAHAAATFAAPTARAMDSSPCCASVSTVKHAGGRGTESALYFNISSRAHRCSFQSCHVCVFCFCRFFLAGVQQHRPLCRSGTHTPNTLHCDFP